MSYRGRPVGFLLGCALSAWASPTLAQVQFGQVDTFEDGSAMGWVHGDPSTLQPQNQPTGGPGGDGDRWLRNVSTGTGSAASRHVMFNRAQWRGNYGAAGVSRLTADVANFGATTLYLRVAVESANLGSAWWVSSQPVPLPPGSGWQTVVFDLTPGAMTDLTNGNLTLAQVLENVGTLRVLSARTTPTFLGDRVNATLGIDNLRATAIPEPAALAAVATAVLLARPNRRKRGGGGVDLRCKRSAV